MRRLLLVCVVPGLLAACEDEFHEHGIEIVDMKAVAPDVGHGFQLRAPKTIIEVGQDIQTCFVPDFPVEQDLFVARADAYQGDVGHHVQLFASALPRTPGETFECTNLAVMSTLLPLLTPNHPGKETDDKKQMPDNFFVRIPAGSRIVMQSHYVNYTDNPIEIADVVNFETVDDTTGMTEANFFVLSHNTFELPEGQSRVTFECDVDADTNLLYVMGHMHEHGTAISVLRRNGAVEDELMYEVEEWTSAFRDDAPTNAYPPSDPLVLRAGDHLTLHCDFNNNTGGELAWPHEMCALFTAYWPARDGGFLLCGE
ncbi:MAG: hypothetical protein Q8O67_29975 [Deltaproteobacteria bacterium]|nr:hypothetical protein [Deltaproteobacteria bacterium]